MKSQGKYQHKVRVTRFLVTGTQADVHHSLHVVLPTWPVCSSCSGSTSGGGGGGGSSEAEDRVEVVEEDAPPAKSTASVLKAEAGVVYTAGDTPRASFSRSSCISTSGFWATIYVDTVAGWVGGGVL